MSKRRLRTQRRGLPHSPVIAYRPSRHAPGEPHPHGPTLQRIVANFRGALEPSSQRTRLPLGFGCHRRHPLRMPRHTTPRAPSVLPVVSGARARDSDEDSVVAACRDQERRTRAQSLAGQGICGDRAARPRDGGRHGRMMISGLGQWVPISHTFSWCSVGDVCTREREIAHTGRS